MKPQDFSVLRLITYLDRGTADCPEIFESRERIEALVGRPARGNGAFIPLRPIASGLDTKTSSSGAYLRETDVGAEIIAALRSKSVIATAGAQTLVGLKGNLTLVVETSGATAVWNPENPGADVAQTDPVFSSRNLSPKTLLGTLQVSRQLLAQSSPDAEAFLRAELGRALGEAVDTAALKGSGTNNQPAGILKIAGIGDLALGTDGGSLSGDNVISLEQKVADANSSPTAFIATPALRARLRKTPRFSTGTTMPVWTDEGTVLGTQGLVTTAMPSGVVKGSSSDCTSLLCGDFSNLVVAFWDAIEIQLDPYTNKKKSELIELSLFAMADCSVLRAAAFAACQDARP